MSLSKEVLERLPQSAVCSSALDLARQTLPEPIFNHSLRVFLAAQWLLDHEADGKSDSAEHELLFVACVCHDLGTSDRFNGPQRFEVEGADAAVDLLRKHDISQPDCHRVWTAIALHTSPGIAERIDSLARIVRRAVLIDFSDEARRQAVAEGCPYDDFVALLPRLDIEKCLANAVVGQAGSCEGLFRPNNLTLMNTQKHPAASWPGILLRAHLENPDYDGINPAF
ncbi:hypothetical protein HIM_03471 [Hirsutella minnesotensis 3608]|uniref:HD/PDEase domain-containing protein n=1 Tax=Hirsutella minnesotensis 3608 TaxID=1043627 RepID=A0A0F7ZQF3_9HYPO|nr:hypothetical protein HIM_03471 [Hirsutella minnesotensis 3608]